LDNVPRSILSTSGDNVHYGNKRTSNTLASEMLSVSGPETLGGRRLTLTLMRRGAGKEARLSLIGRVLMENRNRLMIHRRLAPPTGAGVRDAAIAILDARSGRDRVPVGAEKAYYTADFVPNLRIVKVTGYVAWNISDPPPIKYRRADNPTRRIRDQLCNP
jgi:hypothetical protein